MDDHRELMDDHRELMDDHRELMDERRQLLLPVSDNYFCRFRPRPSSRPTTPIFTTNLG
jgi:hypothetical protein